MGKASGLLAMAAFLPVLAGFGATIHWAVEPMSSEMRLPDAEPADGAKNGTVKVIAARGEYEPGSFVLSSDADLSDATAEVGDLTGPDGAKIAAKELDLKVVLCWYQQGNAWSGYFADMKRRVLTPELLVHDERLIHVDHKAQEVYIRCDHRDGKTDYCWCTYLNLDCGLDHTYYEFRHNWVHDAETIQPFRLDKGKYKQFWLTVHVPPDVPAGLYRGEIKVKSKEGNSSEHSIPVAVRVLDFELPKPATFRDVERPFYATVYPGDVDILANPKIAANLARHNVLNPFLGEHNSDTATEKALKTLEASGLDTSRLFAFLPSSYHTMSDPACPSDSDWTRYTESRHQLTNAVARVRERYGDKTKAMSYGYDEAGADVIRTERAAWRSVHEQGGLTLVSSRFQPYVLYALDAALVPSAPSPFRAANAAALHASNPDMLVGWYAGPHAGPENPDLARMQYGWQTWRSGYDMVAQYALFRKGWAEFNRSFENNLRSLTLAYQADDDLIDTLQWEGIREGLDDIRYATLLKQLATKALKSKDVRTMYAGRAALTWQAQVPYQESSLKALRLETIAKIEQLMELGK